MYDIPYKEGDKALCGHIKESAPNPIFHFDGEVERCVVCDELQWVI